MDDMENNDISQTSPDGENIAPEEYNPYDSFLEDNDDKDIVKKSDDVANKNIQDEVSQESENITTENDIEIPSFLQSSADSSFIQKNPTQEDEFTTFQTKSQKEPIKNNDKNEESENYSSNQNVEKTTFSTSEQAETGSSFDNKKNTTGNNEEQTGGDTNDEDKEESLEFAKKISPNDAEKHVSSKPKVLNKKFILTIIVVVVGLVFLVTFLMPGKGEKKSKKDKPEATQYSGVDYSAFAKKRPSEEQTAENHYEEKTPAPESGKSNNDSNKSDDIPPLPLPQDNSKKTYTSQNISTTTGTGTGSKIEIPDTRNDRLQSKAISGIKGLSSTQASYSTDYQQTISQNTKGGSSSNNTLPTMDEYMKSTLSAYGVGQSTSEYNQQNDQSGKQSFYNNGRNSDSTGQGQYLNLNSLWQGTIFEAVLTSELNTDLPGEITARVAKNIYSSQDGRYLLIPQNSILYGTYNSSISYSQKRVQVAWHTLVRPDGYQIQLGNMNATDAKGASGLTGFVNDHPLEYIKAIGLMSVFTIANTEFEDALGDYADNEYVQGVIANAQQVTNELGDKLIDRAMNVQPTIKIKSGTKINIVVNQNLIVPPCEDIPVTQIYKRY